MNWIRIQIELGPHENVVIDTDKYIDN
jgi:hypothetical protein